VWLRQGSKVETIKHTGVKTPFPIHWRLITFICLLSGSTGLHMMRKLVDYRMF
jgi:hypothetical protein